MIQILDSWDCYSPENIGEEEESIYYLFIS
jgi:hypothetical protein